MPPPPRRRKTPVWPADKRPTWFAPKSDPQGRSRPETWDAFSRDGLWHYQRVETKARWAWHAIYLPTGQWREFTSLAAAREETQAGLAQQLATEAFSKALRSRYDDPDREDGQRLLAIHLRVSGRTAGEEADHRCQCGGFLGMVTSGGEIAHLDACDHCYTVGAGLPQKRCPKQAEHRFCPIPLVAGMYPGCGLGRELCCPGDCYRH